LEIVELHSRLRPESSTVALAAPDDSGFRRQLANAKSQSLKSHFSAGCLTVYIINNNKHV
jgi:hypothetical protein